MLNEIVLSFIQAATEFLPVSSSGHLALFSNFFGEVDLFFITFLHLASLFAVLVFTRKEIFQLLSFKKEHRKTLYFLIIAIIPAAVIGFLFEDIIGKAFSSFLFLGFGFLFTGTLLFLTKFVKNKNKEINFKNSFLIGIFQILALFPGISRSGTTISVGLFSGINREKAAKFSFLLFIPLSVGAFLLEVKDYIFGDLVFNISGYTLAFSFIFCFVLSLVFLNLLYYIIKKEKFWIFSFYCWVVGILCFTLYFFK
jgi:undecaprenyl-diphosphatase